MKKKSSEPRQSLAIIQCFSCRTLFRPPWTTEGEIIWPYACPSCGQKRRFFCASWWYGLQISEVDATLIEKYLST